MFPTSRRYFISHAGFWLCDQNPKTTFYSFNPLLHRKPRNMTPNLSHSHAPFTSGQIKCRVSGRGNIIRKISKIPECIKYESLRYISCLPTAYSGDFYLQYAKKQKEKKKRESLQTTFFFSIAILP